MKDLDEEITARIKAVFDNLDDGGSEKGWALLREKFPEAAGKKFPLWWFTGIAASMLIITGLWLFLATPNLPNTPTVVEKTKVAPATGNEDKPESSTNLLKDNHQKNGIPEVIERGQTVESTKNNQVLKTSPGSLTAQVPALTLQEKNNKLNKEESNRLELAKRKIEEKKDAQPVKTPQANPVTNTFENPIIAKVDTANIQKKNLVIAQNELKTPVPTDTKKTTADFLREQSKLTAAKTDKKDKKTRDISSFDVFTGTFLNYDGNNQSKLSAGFGLNASFKVSKSLSLSVGAGLSQNKLNYENGFGRTEMSQNGAFAMASPVMMGSSYATYTNVQTTVSAQLLNIDLPITLKFYPTKKQNFYLSTGINSNSYLSQKYNYSYSFTNNAINNGQATHKEETEKSKLKGFDFANSAIFAIGINQKIGKNNTLIFEPYFKPAIGYMGDKNLKISTAGLNLKFSFSNPTKQSP